MAENTKIEWAHHTFNPWEGCAKVSPGCKNCYAEGQHRFMYSSLAKDGGPGTCWGINAPRLGRADDYWKRPLKWNAQAEAAGIRYRVFCASMADVFEEQSKVSKSFAGQTSMVPTGKDTKRVVYLVNIDEERVRLFDVIRRTPHLDWLLLTKRPEKIEKLVYDAYCLVTKSLSNNQPDTTGRIELANWLAAWCDHKAPANVWLGTSVENQAAADERIRHLLAAPAAVRFLSCEPLLGPVDLRDIIVGAGHIYPLGTGAPGGRGRSSGHPRINWIIVGGESGPKARPMHPEWVRSLRDQCADADVPFLYKQWGEWLPASMYTGAGMPRLTNRERIGLDGSLEGVHGMPLDTSQKYVAVYRVGKKDAGRELDGQIYDGFPIVNIS